MLDERRSLLPNDLPWFEIKILTQKIAFFGFLGVESEIKWCLEVGTDGFCDKIVQPVAWVKSRWVYNLHELTHGGSTEHDLSHAGILSSIQLGVSVIW